MRIKVIKSIANIWKCLCHVYPLILLLPVSVRTQEKAKLPN